MNDKWIIFERREGTGSQIRFGNRMVDTAGLSEKTLDWLDWYNCLPKEEQSKVCSVPAELRADNRPAGTEDEDAPAQEEAADICGYPKAEDL